jgi:hypothetical protein
MITSRYPAIVNVPSELKIGLPLAVISLPCSSSRYRKFISTSAAVPA